MTKYSDEALRQLAERVGRHMLNTHRVMTTAESCTGGWIAKAITDVAGSSQWFAQGFVTYGNDAKSDALGVSAAALRRAGAVSESVARAMAKGALLRAGAQLAVAVTGIAGPGGCRARQAGGHGVDGVGAVAGCSRRCHRGAQALSRRSRCGQAQDGTRGAHGSIAEVRGELRLFYAARPDAHVARLLEAAAGALTLDASGSARRVAVESYHLTLAFIGGVDATRLADLRRIGALLRAPAVMIRMDAYEYWPKPEVIVAAARGIPASLQQLWEALHAELASQGWALQPKRLRPHVTLARKVAQVPQLPSISAFDWTIREISLISSDTSGTESAYTVVDTWPLLDKPENT